MEWLTSMWSDALDFGQAVYEQWQWLLGGSALVWLLTALANRFIKDPDDKLSPPLRVALVLVLVCFLAWRTEHQDRREDKPLGMHAESDSSTHRRHRPDGKGRIRFT